jgi:hypothetical protein
MKLGRAALLAFAVLIGCTSQSWAQFPGTAICNDFLPIRAAVEKGGAAIQAAMKRKAKAPEVCKLFRTFAAASAKMLKFMETNKAVCGVPDQAIEGAKKNLTQARRIRTQACRAAEAPRPPPPKLSDALGAPPIAAPGNTKTDRGTFDTLTGNALTR